MVGLIDHILPLVPNLPFDLEQGIKVLDIGCGKGKAVNLMAQHFPKSTFYGYDLSKEAIDDATKEAKDLKISNAFFKANDVLDLTFKEKFDLITAFDAIHDQPRPELVLKSIYNSLSDNGVFLMQDILASTPLKDNISHPLGTFPLHDFLSSLHECIIVTKWCRTWCYVGQRKSYRYVKGSRIF